MDKIKEYLAANPQYVTALIITAIVLIAACILGYFIKKYDLLRFMNGWFGKKNAEPDSSGAKNAAQEAENDTCGDSLSAQPHPATDENTTDANTTGENTAGENTEEEAPSEDFFSDGNGKNGQDDGEYLHGQEDFAEEAQSDETSRPQNSNLFSALIKRSLKSEKTASYEEDKKISVPRETVKKRGKETLYEPTPTEKYEETGEQEGTEKNFEGVWRIVRTGNTYVAQLHGKTDAILMRSEHYSTVSGAKKAVESLKKHVKENNFTIAVKGGKFFFKLFSPSGRLICEGEPCATRSDCETSIKEVKRIAPTAGIIRI